MVIRKMKKGGRTWELVEVAMVMVAARFAVALEKTGDFFQAIVRDVMEKENALYVTAPEGTSTVGRYPDFLRFLPTAPRPVFHQVVMSKMSHEQ